MMITTMVCDGKKVDEKEKGGEGGGGGSCRCFGRECKQFRKPVRVIGNI